ncbi:MAG TPA: TPM domain-containing protein [Ignavibacteriaceae bacterium]|nr:TPM domain-containing protein [Ignavibacteriaceae bacterium]
MKNKLFYTYFDDDELLRITNKIQTIEKVTSGEICVTIKEKKKFSERKKSISQLAETQFYKLGINHTRDHTGIIIFLLLEEKQFHILADEGINSKVNADTWEKIKDQMLAHFLAGNFCEGILLGLDEIGRILSEHFPIKVDDTNEISNKVIVE